MVFSFYKYVKYSSFLFERERINPVLSTESYVKAKFSESKNYLTVDINVNSLHSKKIKIKGIKIGNFSGGIDLSFELFYILEDIISSVKEDIEKLYLDYFYEEKKFEDSVFKISFADLILFLKSSPIPVHFSLYSNNLNNFQDFLYKDIYFYNEVNENLEYSNYLVIPTYLLLDLNSYLFFDEELFTLENYLKYPDDLLNVDNHYKNFSIYSCDLVDNFKFFLSKPNIDKIDLNDLESFYFVGYVSEENIYVYGIKDFNIYKVRKETVRKIIKLIDDIFLLRKNLVGYCGNFFPIPPFSYIKEKNKIIDKPFDYWLFFPEFFIFNL